jgi:hypothetical protein
VITLDVADLVLIAGQITGTGTDDALSQFDVAAAQTALAETRSAGTLIVDQDTAAAAATGLMHALLRHRPYALHGEQIAVAAGLQFLSTEPVAGGPRLAGGRCRRRGSAGLRAAEPGQRDSMAVMRDASASRKEPFHPAARRDQRKPPSVSYPQGLLRVQAVRRSGPGGRPSPPSSP